MSGFRLSTVWSSAAWAWLGVLLLVVKAGVFGLGLPVSCVLVRGAWGSWKLKSRQPIDNPRTWLI